MWLHLTTKGDVVEGRAVTNDIVNYAISQWQAGGAQTTLQKSLGLVGPSQLPLDVPRHGVLVP